MKSALLLSCLIGFVAASPLFGDFDDVLEERAVNEAACGRIKAPQTRIVGGTTAQKGQYPWIISLQFKNGLQYMHSCGGSIIDDEWILTAAHCFINSDNSALYRVRVGTFNNSAGAAEREAQEFTVKKIVKHKGFQMSQKITDDIALVKLNGKVNFGSLYVNRICLPTAAINTDNQQLTVAGWGNMVSGRFNKKFPELLQQTKLTAQSDATCKRQWGTMWSDKMMMCASAPNTSPCVGDSGGPLIMPTAGGSYVQVGVVSFGEATCGAGRPPVFTRVSNYISWINDNIAAN